VADNKKTPANLVFAILLAAIGSLTFADVKIPALTVVPVPKETAEGMDVEVLGIKFFDTFDAATVAMLKIKADAEAKAKPKPR
jgi:hypothetical protein